MSGIGVKRFWVDTAVFPVSASPLAMPPFPVARCAVRIAMAILKHIAK